MRHVLLMSCALSALAIASFAGAPVSAQETGAANQAASPGAAAGDEEVVVTARRRSERLVDVPAVVTALNGQALESQGITDLRAAAAMIPQVAIETQQNGSGAVLTIRGIGNTPSEAAFESSVAVNIDGVMIGQTRMVSQGFFDLAQLEVLKGPQALFFGKNSPGGVISLTSQDPSTKFEGTVRETFEVDAMENTTSASVSIPVTNTFAVRVGAQGRIERGFLENLAQPGPTSFGFDSPGPPSSWAPQQSEVLGRVALLWTPDPDLKVSLKVTPGHLRTTGGFDGMELTFCGTVTAQDCVANGKTAVGDLPSQVGKGWPFFGDGRQYDDYSTLLGAFKIDYSTDNTSITSTTGHLSTVNRYLINSSIEPIPTSAGSGHESYSSISEELRLSQQVFDSLKLIGGLYYSYSDTKDLAAAWLSTPRDPITGNYYTEARRAHLNDATYSGFVEGVWKILPDVEFDAGTRYTLDKKTANEGYDFITIFLAPIARTAPFYGKESENNWSPQATLSYHPGADSTLFIGYRTGFKSGGIGAPEILPISDSELFFKPEKVNGVEGGFKTVMLDRKLTLDLSAYYYRYQDLQQELFNANIISFSVANAGRADVRGVEGDATWKVTQGLKLMAAGSFNDATYAENLTGCYAGQTIALGCNQTFSGGAYTQQQLAGQRLPRAPLFSGNIGFAYQTAVTPDWELGFTGAINYSSKYFTSDENNPFAVQSAFAKVDAGITFTSSSGLTAGLIGRNLNNARTAVLSFDRPLSGTKAGLATSVLGDVASFEQRPREIVLQLGYDF